MTDGLLMAPRLSRPRIRPQWNGGLRRGNERDTMTAYLAENPEFAEELRRIHRQLEAWGVEPMPMDGVKQPFDYASRRTCDWSV
jgi:hypothetical protein